MRDIISIYDLANQQYASEPINILDMDGVFYADKSLGDNDGTAMANAIGCIQSLAPVGYRLDNINQAQTSGYSISLLESGGRFLTKLKTSKLYKTKCSLYQAYVDEDNVIEGYVKIHEGEITSPISWSEGNQTLSFNVETILDESLIDYTLNKEDFTYADESVNGKVLPTCFGEVVRFPAVQISNLLVGSLEEPIPSTVFDSGSATFKVSNGEVFPEDSELSLVINGLDFTGTFSEGKLTITSTSLTAKYTDVGIGTRDAADSGYENRQFAWLTTAAYEAGVRLRGMWCVKTIDEVKYINYCIGQFGRRCYFRWAWPDLLSETTIDEASPYDLGWGWCDVSRDYGFTLTSLKVHAPIKWEIPSGSLVMIDGQEEDVTFIANTVTGTGASVVEVMAYRNIQGEDKLVAIPSSYFTVDDDYNISDLVNLDTSSDTKSALAIKFNLDLRLLEEDWDVSNIYVSLQSEVNYNIITTIKYIIDTYTDLTTDSTSFTAVALKFNNIDSGFALLEPRKAIEVCRELAYQCGCGLLISGDTVYIKTIYEAPTISEIEVTLTDDEIDIDSISISQTDFLDILTRSEAEYNIDYVNRNDTIILKNNVDLFGEIPNSINYFGYNKEDLVTQFSQFWLNRTSNIWRTIRFTTYLNALALEPFDFFLLDLTDDLLGTGEVPCVAKNIEHDTNTGKIMIEAWLPVKAGEVSQSSDAFITLTGDTSSVLTGKALTDYAVNVTNDIDETREHGKYGDFPDDSSSNITTTGTSSTGTSSTGTDTSDTIDFGILYIAITQEDAQSDGYISVKLIDSSGATPGLAFDAKCLFPDGATSAADECTPQIVSGQYVSVYLGIDSVWYLNVTFTYVGTECP